MSGLVLYLRCRRVPTALLAAAASTAVMWALWTAFTDAPLISPELAAPAVLLAVTALSTTLGAFDEELERTAAVRWWLRRGVHLTVALAVVAGLLLITGVTDARFGPAGLVLRNAAGLLGLCALGAALIGVQKAWIAPVVWTSTTVVLKLAGDSDRVQAVTWLIQPAGSRAAAVVAVVLALGGGVAYAMRGCPGRTSPDPAVGA
jgi:hypothetical protein